MWCTRRPCRSPVVYRASLFAPPRRAYEGPNTVARLTERRRDRALGRATLSGAARHFAVGGVIRRGHTPQGRHGACNRCRRRATDFPALISIERTSTWLSTPFSRHPRPSFGGVFRPRGSRC